MWSQYLWCLGLVALRHVGSSLDQGSNPCPLELAGGFFFFFFGGWIINHCTTREVLREVFFKDILN